MYHVPRTMVEKKERKEIKHCTLLYTTVYAIVFAVEIRRYSAGGGAQHTEGYASQQNVSRSGELACIVLRYCASPKHISLVTYDSNSSSAFHVL